MSSTSSSQSTAQSSRAVSPMPIPKQPKKERNIRELFELILIAVFSTLSPILGIVAYFAFRSQKPKHAKIGIISTCVVFSALILTNYLNGSENIESLPLAIVFSPLIMGN